jgi:predicted RNA polymerase sigma factor
MPDEAETQALLALMLINHARTEARFRGSELVLLDDPLQPCLASQMVEYQLVDR